jgi:hypothetical protein
MKTTLPPTGSFIRVLRQPADAHIRTVTGLFGWVGKPFPQEGKILAELVEISLIDSRHSTSCQSLSPGDFCITKPTPLLKKMLAEWEKKQREPRDPVVEKVVAMAMSSADSYAAERKAMEKAKAGKTNPFLLRKTITRSSKMDYPTYREFEDAGYGYRLRSIASRPKKLSFNAKVALSWLNEASDATSFWSGDPRVRALVQELDLDPYIRRFDQALYRKEESIFVPAKQLRVAVIRALNKSRVILNISNGRLDDQEPVLAHDDDEVTHFFIRVAQRRKLPAVAS